MANPYVKQTWTDGVSQTTAARMGVMEQGIHDAHYQPCARVFHSAAQAVLTATFTTLAFNSERYDQDGLGTSTIHDNATNNSRLICRVAGVYRISANVAWVANATGYRRMFIRFNGTDLIAGVTTPTNSASIETYQMVACDQQMVVNDYVEVYVEQNSGVTINVNSSAKYSPEFSMHRVGGG